MLMLLWWLSGVASYIFWWTKDYDLSLSDLYFSFGVGVIGPLAFPIGWDVHGRTPKREEKTSQRRPPFILIHKRGT